MNCVKCGDEINPLRVKALPNTRICIGCAEGSVKRKVGITTVNGTGDHTYNDIMIVSEDQLGHTEYEDRLTEQDDAPTEAPI